MTLARRQVVAGAAASLLAAFHLPLGAAEPPLGGGVDNAWVRIDGDGTVTVVVPVSEMGQGVLTALPMILAEELDCDWRSVRAEVAEVGAAHRRLGLGVLVTGDSESIRKFFDPLRRAGALLRETLRAAAAEAWSVETGTCTAAGGWIAHPPSGRRLSYGALAAAAARQSPPAGVELKPRAAWRLIGTAVPRLDAPAKVTGQAVFGIDVAVEGMLVGSPLVCPAFGGTLRRLDPAPALAIPGVHRVVQTETGAIVLADGYWAASKGVRALEPEWTPGPHPALDTASALRLLHAGLDQPGAVAESVGDVDRPAGAGDRSVTAVYEVPFLAHAAIEPTNATVRIGPEGVDIWAPTQAQSAVQHEVATLLGIQPDTVRVHTTLIGGSFGHRLETGHVLQAVIAARAAGRPVKMIWSREADFAQDVFRPAAVARLAATLGPDGMPLSWRQRIAAPSISARVAPGTLKDGVDPLAVEGAVALPYAIPGRHIEYVAKDTGVPVGFWRSVGYSHNTFFAECFIDELARMAGRDPLAYRLALLTDRPRHRAVLERAAAAAGWGRPLPPGRAQGVALHDGYGSVVAEIVEASVEGSEIRLHRVVCAIDCGTAVNPDTVAAQMESGIALGLSEALHGEVRFERGGVQQGNFDGYTLLALAGMPKVEVHIVESGAAIGGAGEPGVPPAAPALANAIAAATGRPVRSLPIRLG